MWPKRHESCCDDPCSRKRAFGLCAYIDARKLVLEPQKLLISSRPAERSLTLIDYSCLCCLYSSYSRAFGDGPRNFEPWSSDQDDT
ncbi:hypothetical protein TNCV_3806681 [Trichonephila clavipes]|nr:hypothetical protein TNCV_3806681 [Trichonephila clavipes]